MEGKISEETPQGSLIKQDYIDMPIPLPSFEVDPYTQKTIPDALSVQN